MPKKKPVPVGRLLKEGYGLQIYALSTNAGYHLSEFEMVTAAFNGMCVVIRVSRSGGSPDEPSKESSQVVLSPNDFETLLASYQAYKRVEKKLLASPPSVPSDDFPFVDEAELP
ncbi:MAG: hypothetical protein ACRDHZ_06515 [Ktedonobacteraceae bacterium]